MKTLSTTALAKKLGIPGKELWEILIDSNFIYCKDNKRYLTLKGKDAGGKIVSTEKLGEFIVWPDDFDPDNSIDSSNRILINATKIGEEFGISNQRVNYILAELGWIEEAIKGWKITTYGRKIGGIQKEHQSGGTFVLWPDTILTNPIFLRSIKPIEYFEPAKKVEVFTKNKHEVSENKYPDSLLKTKDGHLVRSRAELIIDNLLYDYGLTHAYERELTVAETVLSDFYIPARDGRKAVYIEFWGINDNEKYLERKKTKLEIYKSHKLNLINLEDKHLDNLDSYLRKTLLVYNINVE